MLAEVCFLTVIGVANPNEISPCCLFRLPENGDCKRVEGDSGGCSPWGGLKRTGSLALSTADLGIGPFFVVLFIPPVLVT